MNDVRGNEGESRFAILRDDGFKRIKSGKISYGRLVLPGNVGPTFIFSVVKINPGNTAEAEVNFLSDSNSSD